MALPAKPSCVTTATVEPTAILPHRVAITELAATENVNCPLPVPVAPEAIEIHGTEDLAVHEQPLGAATSILPVPAALLKLSFAGLSDVGQLDGGA